MTTPSLHERAREITEDARKQLKAVKNLGWLEGKEGDKFLGEFLQNYSRDLLSLAQEAVPGEGKEQDFVNEDHRIVWDSCREKTLLALSKLR